MPFFNIVLPKDFLLIFSIIGILGAQAPVYPDAKPQKFKLSIEFLT